MLKDKEYFRFRWSHEGRLHRYVVRVANHALKHIPFRLKYGIGLVIRKRKPPYSLVSEGSTVVQVGAPSDTLAAGRSRGMYFSLLSGVSGRVVIVEPDEESLSTFRKIANKYSAGNIAYIGKALWSHSGAIKLFIDRNHPASAFVEGTKSYDEERMKEYSPVEVEADTLDNILDELGLQSDVKLVSITTNGSEFEILDGLQNTINRGLPFICLARTGDGYVEKMKSLGFEFYSHDDRGFTFKHTN